MGMLRHSQTGRWLMLMTLALLLGVAGCAPARRAAAPTAVAATVAPAAEAPAAAQATDEATSTAAAVAAAGQPTSTLAAGTAPAAGAEVRVRPLPAAVNIRRGPGTSYEVIAILRDGETARVVGHEGNGAWFNVVTDAGLSGWVAANVVAVVSGDAGQVGVAATQPALPPAPPQLAPPATATVAPPPAGGQNPPPPKPATATIAPTQNPAMTATSVPAPSPTLPEPTGYPGPTGYPAPTSYPGATGTVNPYP